MNPEYYSKILEGAASKGRGLLIYNLELHGNYFSGFRLVKKFVMERTSTLAETIYIFQPVGEGGNDVMIRVSVAELNSAQNAKARLGQELTQSMRPEIPPGTGELAAVGDVNFAGRGPADLTAGISFTRGNICVTVRNAGPKVVDVSDLAKQIDELLSGERPVEEGADGSERREGLRASAVERPGRLGRAEARRIVVKGKRVTVVPALGEVTAQKGWVRISVPDGELSREGNAVMYRSEAGGNVDVRMSVFEPID